MSVHEIKVMPPEPDPPQRVETPMPPPVLLRPDPPRIPVSEAEEAGALAALRVLRGDPHYTPQPQVIAAYARIKRQQGTPLTAPSMLRRLHLAVWRLFTQRRD